jgi:hypothetical protein
MVNKMTTKKDADETIEDTLKILDNNHRVGGVLHKYRKEYGIDEDGNNYIDLIIRVTYD